MLDGRNGLLRYRARQVLGVDRDHRTMDQGVRHQTESVLAVNAIGQYRSIPNADPGSDLLQLVDKHTLARMICAP